MKPEGGDAVLVLVRLQHPELFVLTDHGVDQKLDAIGHHQIILKLDKRVQIGHGSPKVTFRILNGYLNGLW